MRTSVWKVTTVGALGLALVLGFRPLRATTSIAAPPEHDAPAGADPPEQAPLLADGRGGGDRAASLVAQLRSARRTDEACDALAGLGWTGDAVAQDAIVDAILTRPHFEVRSCAISALGRVPGVAAAARLVALTGDADTDVRDAALDALALRDEGVARGAVLDVARGGDPSARVAAVGALAKAHAPEATALLESELATATQAQQQTLLASLGEGGDPACTPTLGRFAASPSREVRWAALGAAAKVGGAALALLDAAIQRGGEDGDYALRALGEIDAADARAMLVRAAYDPRPAVCSRALSELVPFDGEDVRAAVMMHVGAADAAVATAAARWLALRGDGAAIPSLVEAAGRAAPGESGEDAITALAGLDGDAAHAALVGLASRPGVSREQALRALAESPGGAAEARAIALRMVRDEGGAVASAGLNVLSGDDSPEATRALTDLARSGSPLGSRAVEALGQRHDEASVVALVDLTRAHATPDPRDDALRALAGSSDPRAMRALVDAASDPDLRSTALQGLARSGGADAERALMAAASSADPKARADAARALSSDPPPSLLPDLERLAHDPDAGVSSAAFQALRESSPERALELAREGLRSTDPEQRSAAAERAGQLDTEAARPLMIEALRDPDAAVVVQAASWLGSAGGTDAQQALLDVLEARTSTDEERRAAAQALETMGGAAARDHADLLERWRAEPEEESTGDDDESP